MTSNISSTSPAESGSLDPRGQRTDGAKARQQLLHAGLLVVFADDVSGIIVSTAVAAGLTVIVHEVRSPHALRRLLAAQRGRGEGDRAS